MDVYHPSSTFPHYVYRKKHVFYPHGYYRLRFFRAFSSILRQMPGLNSLRRGTARTLPN